MSGKREKRKRNQKKSEDALEGDSNLEVKESADIPEDREEIVVNDKVDTSEDNNGKADSESSNDEGDSEDDSSDDVNPDNDEADSQSISKGEYELIRKDMSEIKNLLFSTKRSVDSTTPSIQQADVAILDYLCRSGDEEAARQLFDQLLIAKRAKDSFQQDPLKPTLAQTTPPTSHETAGAPSMNRSSTPLPGSPLDGFKPPLSGYKPPLAGVGNKPPLSGTGPLPPLFPSSTLVSSTSFDESSDVGFTGVKTTQSRGTFFYYFFSVFTVIFVYFFIF